jgi:shikimate dehydrogenase
MAIQIDGSTEIFAIVGDPIKQVRTPGILNPLIQAAGRNAIMLPFHAPEHRFEEIARGVMGLANLGGLVITYPFKERSLTLVDELSERAEQIGALNAMRRSPDGRWIGDMFDGVGLCRAIAAQTPINGSRVLLMGAGGAGRAIGLALARAGAAAITVADLQSSRAEWIIDRVRAFYPGCDIRQRPAVAHGHDIIVNATPIGMAPGDALPADIGPVSPTMTVVDIVTYPKVTPLLAMAAAAGAKAISGAAMTNGQADAILEFFGIS